MMLPNQRDSHEDEVCLKEYDQHPPPVLRRFHWSNRTLAEIAADKQFCAPKIHAPRLPHSHHTSPPILPATSKSSLQPPPRSAIWHQSVPKLEKHVRSKLDPCEEDNCAAVRCAIRQLARGRITTGKGYGMLILSKAYNGSDVATFSTCLICLFCYH
jgi:hypothetical protein